MFVPLMFPSTLNIDCPLYFLSFASSQYFILVAGRLQSIYSQEIQINVFLDEHTRYCFNFILSFCKMKLTLIAVLSLSAAALAAPVSPRSGGKYYLTRRRRHFAF